MIFQVMSSEGRLRVSDGQSIVSSEEKLKLETLWQKRKGPRFFFLLQNFKVFENIACVLHLLNVGCLENWQSWSVLSLKV